MLTELECFLKSNVKNFSLRCCSEHVQKCRIFFVEQKKNTDVEKLVQDDFSPKGMCLDHCPKVQVPRRNDE